MAYDPYKALYLHIPFCVKRCGYCDFATSAVERDSPIIDEYVESLVMDIRRASREGKLGAIETVYLGGGTPSYIGMRRLSMLLYALSMSMHLEPEVECTMEANPESLTAPMVRDIWALGVNRLSLGVQSFDDEVLRILGRAHDAEAARAAGRPADAVRLVAVSKFHPAGAVAELAGLGQRDFGENYVQEARAKQEALADLPLRWHAIGPVQTNKAKDVAGRFALIHTVDSERLAEALARRLEPGIEQEVLIQVNIGYEPQKAGVEPGGLAALMERLLTAPRLRVRGLMCLPPRCGEGEEARPYFARLRELRDEAERRFGVDLPHLSMGMSGDYRQAVAEGATLVRVGTDIFGPRPLRP